jgi:hypothetical protein
MARLIALLFILAVLHGRPVCGATISIDPDSLNVVPGQTTWAEIVVHDLNGVVVGGFDLKLFHPDTLSVSHPEFGSLLGTPDLEAITLVTISSGQLRLFEVSLLSEDELRALQSGRFTLARIPFGTAAGATGTLHIEGTLADAAGSAVQVTFADAVVSGVPEPSTTALVGFVLLVLVLRGLRMSSTARLPGGR